MHEQPPQSESDTLPPVARAGRYYFAAFVFYLLLVVYGSLVPLKFRDLPADAAWRVFTHAFSRGVSGAYLSRSDVVANFLLFVPLAFLGMGLLTRGGRARWHVLWALPLLPTLTAIGAGIEYLQVYVPARNPSPRDVAMQACGSLLGAILWALAGRPFTRYVHGLAHHTRLRRPDVQVLGGYLVGFFLYQLMPFNLTISPAEITRKLYNGQINFVPFADPVGYRPYIVFAKFTLLVPVGMFFALWRPGRRVWAAVGYGLLYVVALELAQLLVVEHFTSVTDVILGTGGCLLGGLLGAMIASARGDAAAQGAGGAESARAAGDGFWGRWGWEIKFALTALYVGALALLRWWPLDFRTPPRGLLKQAYAALRVPMHHLYFQNPFEAFTNIARDVGWFMVVGLLLRSLWPNRSRLGWLGSLFLACVLAGGLELGQVFVSRVPDVTSILLGGLGAFAGILAQPFLGRVFGLSPGKKAAGGT